MMAMLQLEFEIGSRYRHSSHSVLVWVDGIAVPVGTSVVALVAAAAHQILVLDT